MAHSVPGLYLLKKAFSFSCASKKPCPLKEEGSDGFPCLKCTVACIDKDVWLHEGHTCTGSKCTQENIVDHTCKNGLARRTQHYGYEYNYSNRSNPLTKTKPLSSNRAIDMFTEILSPNFPDSKEPTQCIVNEYTAAEKSVGQGISPHTDNLCFGPVVMTVSLKGTCVMDFSLARSSTSLTLEPGDVLLLEEDARYAYKHGIKGVQYKDVDPNDPRRVSLTFRTLA